jgi:hypothetical protein
MFNPRGFGASQSFTICGAKFCPVFCILVLLTFNPHFIKDSFELFSLVMVLLAKQEFVSDEIRYRDSFRVEISIRRLSAPFNCG